MKNLKRYTTRSIGLGLAAAICVTGINVTPLLEGREALAKEAAYEEQLEETKTEIEEERTEDTTTYQLADGSKELVVHAGNVRYKNEAGELVDYDPTLKKVTDTKTAQARSLEGYVYENEQGISKNYLPESLAVETPLLLENKDLAMEIQPVTENETSAFAQTKAYDEAKPVEEDYTDIYESESRELTGTMYEAKDQSLKLTYTSNTDGVKETIVLTEKPKTNVFQYILRPEGMNPILNKETGQIELYRADDEDELAAVIEAPYMDDATEDNYSEEVYYELEETEAGVYLLTMTVDESYLENAQYPVTIDPTATWSGSSKIDDVYIADGDYKNTNFYAAASQAFYAGMNHKGVKLRSLIKLNDLKKTLSGKCITSAVLNMYEAGGDAGVTVNSYALTSTRANSSATWANQPSINATVLGTCKSSGTIGQKQIMDMTKFVQGLANGSRAYNYGIMLRSTNETNKKYAKFYGVRFTTAAKRPTLVIKYVDGPATATSVTASPNYLKKGGTTKVSWEGIDSSYLSYVQYRLQVYGAEDNLVDYSSGTKIGTTASGSANIKMGDWADGKYRIYVRGVDKGGIKGTGKGVSVVIDSTNPVVDKAAVSPATSASAYSAKLPTVSWKVTDTNFRDVYYSTDKGATWKKLSTAKEGSAAIPASAMTKTGLYQIYLRAYDKAGNYKNSAAMNYYYDNTAPKAETVTRDEDEKYVTVSLNQLSETVDTNKCYYAVKKSGEKAPASSEYIKASDISYKNNCLSVKIPVSDKMSAEGVYEIYVAAGDKAGNIAYSAPAKAVWYHIPGAVYDGTLRLEADKNDETPQEQWKLTWSTGSEADDKSSVVSADVYESLDGKNFYKKATSKTGELEIGIPTVNDFALYRIVATCKDGTKQLSNIQGLRKEAVEDYIEEQELEMEADIPDEDIDTLVSMDAVAVDEESEEVSGEVRTMAERANDYVFLAEDIDTDEDQLPDGYEMWDTGSDRLTEDSDFDGFEDYYEVTVLGSSPSVYTQDQDRDGDGLTDKNEMEKGTNPYLPDSDFDGILDAKDTEPLKTDVSTGKQTSYKVIESNNKYEQKIVITDNGASTYYFYNPYSDLNTKIERTASDGKKRTEYYFYDSEKQVIGILKSYAAGLFDAITNNYDENGQIIFTACNGLGYTLARDSEGDLQSVSVNGKKLLENTFVTVGEGEEAYGEQTKTTFANGQGEIYEYAAVNVTDDEGNTTKERALKGVKIDGSSSYSYGYEYDSKGNIVKLHDYENNVTYSYAYDESGEVNEITASNGFHIKKENDSENDSQTRTYSIGNVQHTVSGTEQSDDNGTTATSVIDSNIQVKELRGNTGSKTRTVQYKNKEVLKSQEVSSGNKIELTLGGEKVTYVQDDWGNLISITGSGKVNGTQKFEYNDREELIKETNSSLDRMNVYGYDGNGNRTSKKEYSASGQLKKTTTYQYDTAWRDKLTGYTENGTKTAITSDASGNPLNWRNGWKFTWRDGKLLSKAENTNDTITYKYNIMGMRTQKKVTDKATGKVTSYDYIWDGNYPVREVRTTGSSRIVIDYLYDESYNVIGFAVSGNGNGAGTYLYEKDMQDNVIGIYKVTDTSADCVADYTYDAYGELVKIKNYTDQKIGDLNPYRYRSYYQDDETDFYYLQSRYYDACMGRFLNMDNILYLGADANVYNNSYNMFAYCENNPVNYTDGEGQKPSLKKMKNFVNKYMGGFYRSNGKTVYYWGSNSPQSIAGYCDIYDSMSRLAGANIAHQTVTSRVSNKTWRFEFWRGSYAYGYMYGGEIGLYYSNKVPSVARWYKAAKKTPINMQYALYNKKGKRLYSAKTKKTWWENGFVFQPKNGYYNKKNLKMRSVLYFYSNKLGTQQRTAFLSGVSQMKYCKVINKGNTIVVEWYK